MLTYESIMKCKPDNRILYRENCFMYILPHPILSKWVSNYTISFPGIEAMSEQYTVIPHGCATIVFSADNRKISSSLFGPITKKTEVGHEANQAQMLFIIEFQPAGYYALNNIPQNELTDKVFPFINFSKALHQSISQQIENACEIETFIEAIDSLLFKHISDINYPQELHAAEQLIVEQSGMLSIRELSKNVYYSERQLNRTFHKYIGMNTKSFSRLVRVNKALHMLQSSKSSVLMTGVENGFYDNAHFIHDFTSICGISPQKYRENMSDFYNEVAKY